MDLAAHTVRVGAVELRKLEITHEPARLEIREILAKDPYLRQILAPNGVTSVQPVLAPGGAARLAAEIAAERAGREQEKKESRRGCPRGSARSASRTTT